MRISDWSSDVCSSDLVTLVHRPPAVDRARHRHADRAIGGQGAALGAATHRREIEPARAFARSREARELLRLRVPDHRIDVAADAVRGRFERSEEHTSELQSLMRNSYAVFCLKKKKRNRHVLSTLYAINE